MKSAKPWEPFRAAFKKRFDFITVEDIARAHINASWKSLQGWEELDDIDIYNELNRLRRIAGKELFIVTDALYPNNGPIKIGSKDLPDLVTNHLSIYGECFFDGDAAIISIDNKEIWAFHHEGVFSYISL